MEDLSVRTIIDIFLHLDKHLTEWAIWMGPWLYGLLFLVVFAETGLVVTPFLPGDSLLFATGALTVPRDLNADGALEPAALELVVVAILLIIAAVLGDAVNYSIGRFVGPRVFTAERSFLLNKKHLLRTQRFYERHGGKTIIMARFMPIIRTFAPFVAGIGKMSYARFAAFNVIGAVSWVVLFLVGGHLFGNLPTVQKNFHYVILGIVFVSVLPIVFEVYRAWRHPEHHDEKTSEAP
ncbi:MAG: DedA family protein [Deltaproteobacteria bacterium]|nr:DedA family protein [Deltaproteobacteria bacterium]